VDAYMLNEKRNGVSIIIWSNGVTWRDKFNTLI